MRRKRLASALFFMLPSLWASSVLDPETTLVAELHEKFERPPLYRTGSRALHEQGSGWTPKVFVSKQQAEDAIDNFRTQEARHYDASWAQFAGLPGPGWYIVDSDGRVIR